jgi:hypothetical protein
MKMKDYKELDKVYEITLENGKVVKVDKKWAQLSMEKLETDLEDVLLMYLEDNDYLENDAQNDLDQSAKANVKVIAKSEKPKKKTQRERVVKENPTKELIISKLTSALQEIDNISNVNVENKAKLITFSLNNEDFKVDLVQKRKEKVK